MKTFTQEFMRLISTRHPGDTERKISVVRLLILFALLPILWWDVVSPETEIILIGLTALVAVYILAALLVLPRLRRALRKDLTLSIDILAITALVWYTGGIRSSLLFLFYFPILTAAVRLDLRQAILSALAVSGIVGWMWTAIEGHLPSLGSTTLRVGLFTGSTLVLAFFFSILAQESRQLRERAEMNRRLNKQLTEATDQLRRRLGELEFAYDLSRRLAGTGETATVLTVITEAARQLLGAPYGGVFLTDHMGGELVAAHTVGVSDQETAPLLAACAREVTAETAEPVQVEVEASGTWTRSVCAPIVVGERLLGVLCAGGGGEWEAARHSVAILGQVASQAGLALDRAALLEDLQRLTAAKPEARVFERQQFERILRNEIGRATKLGAPFALLRLSLVNISSAAQPDGRGTELVHRRFAGIVLNAVRRADVVAQGSRGEAFVLLSMTNLPAAEKFAERLRAQLGTDATLARLFGGSSPPEIRIGIAMFPQDAVTGPELAYAAQNALDSTDAARPVVLAHELESIQPPSAIPSDPA